MLVGTCGFAEAQDRTFQDFDILEVQRTFYQPPRLQTAARWRSKAPTGFVFAIKAWQLLTHPPSSSTYRRLKEPLSRQQQDQVGSFKWNEVTQRAWQRIQAIADALAAEVIVFQTPRQFRPTSKNLQQLRHFFEQIDRYDRWMVFEPRGAAWDKVTLQPLVEDLGLVHGVDPFLQEPVGGGLRYFRLHGRPAYNYRYHYTEEDLTAVVYKLDRRVSNYILFNNDSMADDARSFLQYIR